VENANAVPTNPCRSEKLLGSVVAYSLVVIVNTFYSAWGHTGHKTTY
jgi:hypothetical protein